MRAFFDRWYPALVRFLTARVGDRDQAEDLAQEAFVRLLEARPRHPRASLFRVAENLARDQGRLARGRARHLKLIAAESAAPDPGPEGDLLRKLEVAGVQRVLRRLPPRDRALGGGDPDDGILTLNRPGQVVDSVVLYEDLDGSRGWSAGDRVLWAGGAAPRMPSPAVRPPDHPAAPTSMEDTE